MSTVGVDVSDWTFRPKKAEFPLPGRGDARPNIKFVTWDFGGQVRQALHVHLCSVRGYRLSHSLVDQSESD